MAHALGRSCMVGFRRRLGAAGVHDVCDVLEALRVRGELQDHAMPGVHLCARGAHNCHTGKASPRRVTPRPAQGNPA